MKIIRYKIAVAIAVMLFVFMGSTVTLSKAQALIEMNTVHVIRTITSGDLIGGGLAHPDMARLALEEYDTLRSSIYSKANKIRARALRESPEEADDIIKAYEIVKRDYLTRAAQLYKDKVSAKNL